MAYRNIKTFAKKLDEFHTYIDNNSTMIPNYGESGDIRKPLPQPLWRPDSDQFTSRFFMLSI